MKLEFNATTLIALGLLIVLALFLVFKGCGNKTVIVNEDRSKSDSLTLVKKKLDSVYKYSEYRDSILSHEYNADTDSLSKALDKTKKTLQETKAANLLLLAKAAQIPKEDTARRLANCDSIKRENLYLIENVADYERATDQLSNQNVELVYAQRALIKTKDSLFHALSTTTNFMETINSRLIEQKEALKKKADKRIVIGPGVGATYWDGKPTAVGGIFVVYRIGRL